MAHGAQTDDVVVPLRGLVVVTGPMFCGKSRRLAEIVAEARARGGSALLVAPAAAGRARDAAAWGTDALLVDAPDWGERVPSGLDVLCVDEAHLMPGMLTALYGVRARPDGEAPAAVVVACLRGDFRQVPFAVSSELVAMADFVEEMQLARCGVCGVQPAGHSMRLDASDTRQLAVGGDDLYAPACRDHHPCGRAGRLLVFVDGPPGCGKSTALAALAAALGPRHCAVLAEPVDSLPDGLLAAYYADMPRWCGAFQATALAMRLGVLDEAPAARVVVVERSPEADRACFARVQAELGIMDPLDAAVYERVSARLVGSSRLGHWPALHVFLRCTAPVCGERAVARNRAGERLMGRPGYLEAVVDAHAALEERLRAEGRVAGHVQTVGRTPVDVADDLVAIVRRLVAL